MMDGKWLEACRLGDEQDDMCCRMDEEQSEQVRMVCKLDDEELEEGQDGELVGEGLVEEEY